MPPFIRSMLNISARRKPNGIPSHLAYPWQQGQPMHRIGAAIIDREAFQRALDAALPSDACDYSPLTREG